MDFKLNEKQVSLQAHAQNVVLANYSSQHIREDETSSDGFARSLWDASIKQGWPGMIISDQFGGSSGSLLDFCVLLEETGRSGATLPLIASAGISSAILSACPASPIRDNCLSNIASGIIVSPALIDEVGRNEWDKTQLPLTGDAGEFSLSGVKAFVPYGSSAEDLLVTAMLPSGDTAILVIPAGEKGVTRTRHSSEIGTPLSWIKFDDVKISAQQIVCRGEDAVSAIHIGLRIGALLSTAEAVGLSDRIKLIAADYVKNRHAFGRPIGMFQAVAHPCADMHISVETIRILTQQAAWLADTGQDATEEILSTKALANELFERVANDAFCMHGAEGYAEACDLQLYMRRVRGFCNLLGETQEALERAAQSVGF